MILTPTARGLIILYIPALLDGIGWGMILPTIPVLSVYFGVSVGAAAQTVTAYAVGRFVGTPIAGIVLDRFGTRAAIVGGPLAAGLAALLALGSPWFSAILVSLFVIGAGDTIWALGLEVAGIDLVHQNQRGRVISGFHGMHNGGLALGPLLGGVLTEALSFRAVFVAYVISAALAVLIGFMARIVRSPVTSQPMSKPIKLFRLKERLLGIRDLFKQIQPHLRATYAVLVIATTTSIMFRLTIQAMLPLYAGSHLGFAPTEVGLLFSISGAFVFAMILPAGFILDKIGRKWATVPSTGLPALAFLLIPFSDTFLELAVLVSITGIANGLSLGSLATSTYDVVPPAARGRLQAARRTVAEMGGIAGPLIGGLLANAFNPGVPFLVYAPLILGSAVLLAMVARETLIK
jgi:MFS family permease